MTPTVKIKFRVIISMSNVNIPVSNVNISVRNIGVL
jgi:hypothetical protein